MADLDALINDNLHKALGFSDKTTVQYIKSVGKILVSFQIPSYLVFLLAKSAKSIDALKTGLDGIDFPINASTEGFISQLYNHGRPEQVSKVVNVT